VYQPGGDRAADRPTRSFWSRRNIVRGALHAHRFGVYQPTDLGFHLSLLLFVYVIVGGKNSIYGPLLGTFSLHIMPELIKIAPEAELIVFGALMIVVAVRMPGGLAGAAKAAFAWLTRHHPHRESVRIPDRRARSSRWL